MERVGTPDLPLRRDEDGVGDDQDHAGVGSDDSDDEDGVDGMRWDQVDTGDSGDDSDDSDHHAEDYGDEDDEDDDLLFATDALSLAPTTLVQRLLDSPSLQITNKLITFLSADDALRALVRCITLRQDPDAAGGAPEVSPTSDFVPLPRAEPTWDPEAEPSEELRRSYRAMALLTSDEPTDSLLTFLSPQAPVIVKGLFEAFLPDARGSFYHACHSLDHLLRHRADDVYELMGKNWAETRKLILPLLRCCAHAPVGDAVAKILYAPSVGSGDEPGQASMYGSPPSLYSVSPQKKWNFYKNLAHGTFLLRLVENVFGSKHAPDHSAACAALTVEVLERWVVDENCEILLQPIGHCAELVDGLAEAACDADCEYSKRACCARVLTYLVATASPAELPACGGASSLAAVSPSNPAAPPLTANQMHPLGPLLRSRVKAQLPALAAAMLGKMALDAASTPGAGDDGEASLRHPGRYVNKPFTELRLQLVKLHRELVSADAAFLSEISLPTWRALCGWFFEHAHSNLYHNLFKSLVVAALRANDEGALQCLLQKCKLLHTMVEAFPKLDASVACADADVRAAALDGNLNGGDRGFHPAANEGHILDMCNAVRLQAAAQPPSSWLRQFLQSHQTWRGFVPRLRACTLLRETPGLGVEVPPPMYGLPSADADTDAYGNATKRGIDLGSAYADKLGFVGEQPWPEAPVGGGGANAKKKRRNKGKKGKNGAGAGNGAAAATVGAASADDDADGSSGQAVGAEDSTTTLGTESISIGGV